MTFRPWTARYPHEDLQLAYMYFHSDRRRAGLGALDVRLRRRGSPISNSKSLAGRNDELVMYRMRLHRPRRAELLDLEPALYIEGDTAGACVTMKIIDEVNLACNYPCLLRELNDPYERPLIARRLLQIRREMRK